MAKGFLEVFPTLNIAEPLKELLALAEVEKVTSARDRSSIRVYMKSTRLIHKQNIYDLERGIKDQLFPDKQITIKIQEKYRLSGQYTPEKLLKMYKDSLLLELKHYSIVEYSMFRKAQIVFEDEGKMVLTVEDTMVNRDKTNELKRVLEKVFNERCGLPVEVAFQYIPPKENDRRKQIELKLEREAQAIYWQNHKDELENACGHAVIPISAKEEQGIEALEEEIKRLFYHGKISFNEQVYITNVRHKEALEQTLDSLKMVKQSVSDGMPEDFYSIDLMNAYEQLGKILGEAVEDDLVNEIFSKFCMGK